MERIILVTNDDSINSPGIRALVEIAKQYGRVVVVAPDQQQSAQGHSITIGNILRLKKVDVFEGVEAYECSGTPVDCVKLAVDKILDKKPDLCFSGINHGSNAAMNVIYSGTMSAAMEAAMNGINSIGFSHLAFSHEADMSAAIKYAHIIIDRALNSGFPVSKLLNVNFPDLPAEEIKGIKICHQANAKWKEEYDERKDPFGGTYYWLTGEFVNSDTDEEADIVALENGYVSVVPVQYDLTAYEDVKRLRKNWLGNV